VLTGKKTTVANPFVAKGHVIIHGPDMNCSVASDECHKSVDLLRTGWTACCGGVPVVQSQTQPSTRRGNSPPLLPKRRSRDIDDDGGTALENRTETGGFRHGPLTGALSGFESSFFGPRRLYSICIDTAQEGHLAILDDRRCLASPRAVDLQFAPRSLVASWFDSKPGALHHVGPQTSHDYLLMIALPRLHLLC